jgi:hypothetical protein
MLDLKAHADVAVASAFNLTGPLRHDTVVQLADAWTPEVRFHEAERFHPVDFEAMFTVPPAVMATLDEATRDTLRIQVGNARFEPPIIRTGSDTVPASALTTDVLADPTAGAEVQARLSSSSVYTHGGGFDRSTQLFGASTTVAGLVDPTPGDPRVPRHPIVVRAEMRFLYETLKHDLQTDRPNDALWGRFAVEASLFQLAVPGSTVPFTTSRKRDILRRLIAAIDAGDDVAQAAALADIPPPWQLNGRAWDAVRNYAFLEFYFLYAFNDYLQVADSIFSNEHEGDNEGCCVVFDRRDLEELAAGTKTLDEIVAHTIITSVHEEFNDNDELKRLPLDRDRARDDLVVYVAVGSHATYLTAGSHDVLDFEDILTDFPGKVPGWAWLIPGAAPVIVLLLLITAVTEHFVDAEDETSDNGASTGPEPEPGSDPGPLVFPSRRVVTPLSAITGPDADVNAYQAALTSAPATVSLADLTRRAFPGTWGGHDGLRDHSPKWENKTARYFRKFVHSGDVRTTVIT